MLGRFGFWRHLLVAGIIAACATLAFLGYIGGRGERFDAKQITVSPAGGEGIHIREVVDEDFGDYRRHGYQRIIPNTFGIPTAVDASSPDANADVDVAQVEGFKTRIRLGDSDKTYTGQHRYVLSYTYPDGQLSSGRLNLNIIDAGEKLETRHFVVVITGFVLQDAQCNVGGTGKKGGCTLEQVGSDYRVEFSPLAEGDGVNIDAQITGFGTPVDPELPPLPKRAVSHRVQLGLGIIGVGLLGAIVVFVVASRKGRDEVFSGGAAEAAYGKLPTPSATGAAPAVSTRLVSARQLEDMSTIEFVPPKGIAPWQGSVLLSERINDETVAAWFSALAAADAITLAQDKHDLVISSGPRRPQLSPADAALLTQAMGGRDQIHLGKYDPSFAAAWASIKELQGAQINSSGWWRKHPPSPDASKGAGAAVIAIIVAIVLFTVGGAVVPGLINVLHLWPIALGFGFLMSVWAAYAAYATLLPARSATGSSIALLTESFRKFLQASEGRHVEWAWTQGLLREYSAWAVALGAADAWGRALSHSNVPPDQQYYYSSPLLVHSMASSFSSTHTAPSSSGGSGGGGVGGGGGGGSSGSW